MSIGGIFGRIMTEQSEVTARIQKMFKSVVEWRKSIKADMRFLLPSRMLSISL